MPFYYRGEAVISSAVMRPATLTSIVDSFDKHKALTAFCIAGKTYSYADLKSTIAKIQSLIKKNQIEPGSHVGLVIHDDIETYASIYAILFSGCAFVPLNPRHPVERNERIAELAELKLLLSSRPGMILNGNFPAVITASVTEADIEPITLHLLPDQSAYLLFTSGSTGIPKGVPVTVANLNAFLEAFFSLGYELDSSDRFIQMFDLTFDLSILGCFAPLCIGASVYTVPFDSIKYLHVYKLLVEHRISIALLAPSVLTHLRPYFPEISLPDMKYSLFCGEALYEDIALEWSACLPSARIQNVYGPTEATVFCSFYDVNRSGANKSMNGMLSIGKAMSGMKFCIADAAGNPVADSVQGELCIAGKQLTPGYWKNDVLNQEAFIIIKGERYYRSGDVCMKDRDGDIFFLGRVDFQVKINGFRVELEEIEFHARRFLNGVPVVVQAIKDEAGAFTLHLFLESGQKDFQDLDDYLKSRLPAYMIPSRYFAVPVFPQNANGKTDRRALLNLPVT